MGDLFDSVGSIASFIGSLTVVGGALIWIYNKFIGDPREKRREREETKRQAMMLETITRENQPLNESIIQLTEWLNESKTDRENLHNMANENRKFIEEHDEILNNHDDRLILLEFKNGLKVGGR